MPVALIVHGGAGDISPEGIEPHRRGAEMAAQKGWQVLKDGGSALDAVEAAIVVLEDDPAFDAGFGSVLNRDGQVEMDASIMDGQNLQAGAVAGVQRVKNAIRLARRVLESEHTFLISTGAERFAQEKGIPLVANSELIASEQLARWKECLANPPKPIETKYVSPQGTVGCVAVDGSGRIAAGTSTGGMRFKRPGRVGDSPIIGSGVYADGELGGASATGWGEAIMRVVLCKYAVDGLAGETEPNNAARAAIEMLAKRVGGTAGLIMLDRKGRIGYSYNTAKMAFAYMTDGLGDIVSRC